MPAAKKRRPANPESASAGDIAPVVGGNLRALRQQRQLSLEKLAQLSGVSRAMLNQIELGKSAPTINVVWKIARSLGVPFSALLAVHAQPGPILLRANQAKVLTSHDQGFVSRALFPVDEPRKVEFYELRLKAKAVEEADAHPPGTTENLVVSKGALELETRGERHSLRAGDAILFAADAPHVYRNPADTETVMYLVMTYADSVG